MSDFVTSAAAFAVLGILLPLLSLIGLWWWRGRRPRAKTREWQGRHPFDRW